MNPATSLKVHYEQSAWDLSELLPSPEPAVLDARLAELEAATAALEARRHELAPDMRPALLVDFLRQYEAWSEAVDVVESYGHLWFAADTQSDAALSFRNRVQQLVTELANRTLFFKLWWKGLSDAEAERLAPDAVREADLRHYLDDLRRWRPFTLEEANEKIINLKDADGVGGLVTLYSMLTNRLEFRLEIDGGEQVLTRDELMGNVYSTDPARREAAYRELYRVYSREATVLGQIYTYRVRDWFNENVVLRGFDSPIAVRNLANDVPSESVDALLQTTRENRHLFQRYFRLKARWLGMDRLRRYDVYAPLQESRKTVPWIEAVDEVLAAFHEFAPQLAAKAERVFAEGHVDSEVRRGKRGGAFCSTVSPRFTPWVLVNFTGRPRDVAEVAHELGHAVHSMSAEHHSSLTQHPSLPLAETASVFAEMLVTERLLARERDPKARREILDKLLSDVYATVLRQAYFVLFEIAAHRAVLEGKSVPELSALYLELLAEQFGDSVEVSPEFQHEWVSIPHLFHTPFYCYAYSFGQLLVLSLYRRYQEQGEAFKPGYLKLLAYGGSERPETVLAEAGIDVRDSAFWQGGFDVVRDLLAELEQLST